MRPQLMRLQDESGTVALALIGRSWQRRRRWIRSRTLHLNETGDTDLDAITLEHNDIVALAGREAEATQALLGQLARRDDWDEFFLGGLGLAAHERWQRACEDVRLNHVVRWCKEFYFVDLDKVRSAQGGYLAVLSVNTRHQIRRSMKRYGQHGPLTLQHAGSIDEALQWLDQLAELHQEHWISQGQRGAFGTDFQRRFHTTLVRRGWPHGAAEIVRVTAGNQVLGYLYNLRKGGTLHNYQAGLAYETDSQLKPGMVCHAMVAEDAARRGLARYDLLMGGDHYKRRLTNASSKMAWCVLQQRRLSLSAESVLRRLAARFRRQRADPGQ